MPQMGDLLQGFLYRKREQEEEEVAEEQKKRQKLEDQLRELNFTELQRDLERDAKEWEKQQDLWKAFGELSPEEQKQVQFPGIKEEEEAELPYPWMGTPYEEAGARKEFYIKPETEGKTQYPPGLKTSPGWSINPQTGQLEETEETLDISDIQKITSGMFKPSTSYTEMGDVTTRADSLLAGLPIGEPKTGREKLYLTGREAIESKLEKALTGFLGEGKERPEEDAYIQQVKPYMSDYDIDWDVIAKSHPNWDIEYIKEKLGQ